MKVYIRLWGFSFVFVGKGVDTSKPNEVFENGKFILDHWPNAHTHTRPSKQGCEEVTWGTAICKSICLQISFLL